MPGLRYGFLCRLNHFAQAGYLGIQGDFCGGDNFGSRGTGIDLLHQAVQPRFQLRDLVAGCHDLLVQLGELRIDLRPQVAAELIFGGSGFGSLMFRKPGLVISHPRGVFRPDQVQSSLPGGQIAQHLQGFPRFGQLEFFVAQVAQLGFGILQRTALLRPARACSDHAPAGAQVFGPAFHQRGFFA